MKETKDKEAFIIARAEGKSYSKIAGDLKISKGTCTKWERELKSEIDELKKERLEDLYTAYHMTREARIKALGDTLERINDTLGKADLEAIPPEKLLSLKLKYERELKEEYKEAPAETDNTLDGLMEQYDRLYEEAGDIKDKLGILSAKKETLKDIASELTSEEDSGLNVGDIIGKPYTSKLLREHEA